MLLIEMIKALSGFICLQKSRNFSVFSFVIDEFSLKSKIFFSLNNDDSFSFNKFSNLKDESLLKKISLIKKPLFFRSFIISSLFNSIKKGSAP